MKTLFIIGNGFDIRHNLDTRYVKFRDYLENTYPNHFTYESKPSCPTYTIGKDGEEIWKHDEVVGFIIYILNLCQDDKNGNKRDEWGYLEKWLGEDAINHLTDLIDDFNFDSDDEWAQAINQENDAENLQKCFSQTKKYFIEWINNYLAELKLPKKIDEIDNMFKNKENSVFLTFNYTKTLENLYGCPETKITHIHGLVRGLEQNIAFGHGNTKEYVPGVEKIGAEFNLNDLRIDLRKDTKTIFNKNKDFFSSLADIDEIYSYGFSFSEVDMYYIKKINKIAPKATWYLNTWDSNNDEYKDKLEEAGFTVNKDNDW